MKPQILSNRGFIYPLSRRSPQGRRRMAAIYSRSSRCERRPRRSCVAAETGRGTAFALGFPIGGSLRCPCSIGNDIHTACGRYPALPDDIHACGVDDICEPGLANDEAPKPFRFRGFIYPGSYLLSRDLSSDYHRRADVSLPGSEWDRVGPSGYDHQVSVLRASVFLLTS